jgi:hypothetical protein
VYTVKERTGVGYYFEDYTRKVFGCELKKVDTIERKIHADGDTNNFPDIRRNNRRENTIERRLMEDNLFETFSITILCIFGFMHRILRKWDCDCYALLATT